MKSQRTALTLNDRTHIEFSGSYFGVPMVENTLHQCHHNETSVLCE